MSSETVEERSRPPSPTVVPHRSSADAPPAQLPVYPPPHTFPQQIYYPPWTDPHSYQYPHFLTPTFSLPAPPHHPLYSAVHVTSSAGVHGSLPAAHTVITQHNSTGQDVAVEAEVATKEKDTFSGKRKHTFVCRHTCGCEYKRGDSQGWRRTDEAVFENGKLKYTYNKEQQKHEESASYHPCMCKPSRALCSGIDQAYMSHPKRSEKIRERFARRLVDASSGHQHLRGKQIRGESGELSVKAKRSLIEAYGLHTLQLRDLDSSEREQQKQLSEYLNANPSVDWHTAQAHLLPHLPTAPSTPPQRPITIPRTPPSSGSKRHDRTSPPALTLASTKISDVRDFSTVANLPQHKQQSLRYVQQCVHLTSSEMFLEHHMADQSDRLEGSPMFIPLVHVRAVRDRVANSVSGAVVFTPPPMEQPLVCDKEFKLEHAELYNNNTASHWPLPLTVLGEGEDGPLGSQEKSGRPAGGSGYTEEEFYSRAMDAWKTGKVERTWYMKDVELQVTVHTAVATVSGKGKKRGRDGSKTGSAQATTDDGFEEPQRVGLWGALWGPAVDGGIVQQDVDNVVRGLSTSTIVTTTAQRQRVRVFAKICRSHKLHPLNPHLFNVHPRSLLHILVHDVHKSHPNIDWVNVRRPDSDKDQQKAAVAVDAIKIPGFMSPMVYVKHSKNFFRGHIEQLAAPSFNRCDSGGQYWIVVPYGEQRKMLPLLEALLQHKYPELVHKPLTADERALLPTLLLSRQLFIPPSLLDEHGIQYYRYHQKAGDVMIVQGYSFHQGVVDSLYEHAHAEAINYLDLNWLQRDNGGLRVVYDVCRWACNEYSRINLDEACSVRSAIRGLMFNTYRDGIGHFIPIEWSKDFFGKLIEDIERWLGNTSAYIDYDDGAVLTREDGQVAIARLQYCLDVLNLKEVDMLCRDRSHYETNRSKLVQERRAGKKRKPAPQPPTNDDDGHISIFSLASATVRGTQPQHAPSPSPLRHFQAELKQVDDSSTSSLIDAERKESGTERMERRALADSANEQKEAPSMERSDAHNSKRQRFDAAQSSRNTQLTTRKLRPRSTAEQSVTSEQSAAVQRTVSVPTQLKLQ